MDISFTKDMKKALALVCTEQRFCSTCPFKNDDGQCIACLFFDEESDAPTDWDE